MGPSHAAGMWEHQEKPALSPLLGWEHRYQLWLPVQRCWRKPTPSLEHSRYILISILMTPPHRCHVKQLILRQNPSRSCKTEVLLTLP